MARSKSSLNPLLVWLLVAALLGPGVVAGAESRTTVTAALTITGSAALPVQEDMHYSTSLSVLNAWAEGLWFTVPLTFPAPVVTIKRITAYVYDNSAWAVGVSLMRAHPPTGQDTTLGEIWSTGASLTAPRTVTSSEISPRTVNTANYPLYLRIGMSEGTRLYGVKILYTYETGA